jgi:predicted O-methyltransferase YrrM
MLAALLGGLTIGYGLAHRERIALIERLDRQRRIDYRQTEALLALRAHLPLRAPLPPMRGYAISPDFAVILMEIIRDYRPQHIVELGCGVSTLIGGYANEVYNPDGYITSLEHQPAFAQFTRDNLDLHELDKFATVVDAPLQRLDHLRGWRGHWYDRAALPLETPIELLVIDGPPQYRNPSRLARYPALPMLYDSLVDGALILIDDADRRHERRAVKRWLREFPLSHVRHYDTEKGTLVLQKN